MKLPNRQEKIYKIAILLLTTFVLFSIYLIFFNLSEFDLRITLFLQRYIPRNFDLPFSLLSLLGSAEVTFMAVLLLGLFLFYKKYYLALLSLLLFPTISIIEILGKLFIYHPKPPFNLFRGILNLDLPSQHYVQTSYSYPSGHVTRTTFLIVFFLAYFYLKNPKIKPWPQIFLVLLLFLMLVSRVYLAEHWASDVLGGLLLGTSFGLFSAFTLPNPILSKKDSSV